MLQRLHWSNRKGFNMTTRTQSQKDKHNRGRLGLALIGGVLLGLVAMVILTGLNAHKEQAKPVQSSITQTTIQESKPIEITPTQAYKSTRTQFVQLNNDIQTAGNKGQISPETATQMINQNTHTIEMIDNQVGQSVEQSDSDLMNEEFNKAVVAFNHAKG